MMHNLTGFQRDMLYVISSMGKPKGLAIKQKLQEEYEIEINHGRLYPNLDDMVDMGLIEKGVKDKRTNEYSLSEQGRELIEQRRQWEDKHLDLEPKLQETATPPV